MSAPDWEEAMDWWRGQSDLVRGMIRTVAVAKLQAYAPDQGISSSDMNHTVYGMYQSFKSYREYCNSLKVPVSVAEFCVDEMDGIN